MLQKLKNSRKPQVILCKGIHDHSKAFLFIYFFFQVIETMTKGKGPFVNDKTRSVMKSRIENAVFLTRCTDEIEDLKKKLEIIQRQLTQDENLSWKEKKNLQDSRIEIEKNIEEYEKKEDAWRKEIEQSVRRKLKEEGGCYPGSAIVVDTHGRRRQMDSLEVGDEVQVIINNEIRAEPVITFIHRQPEVVQEFLQITTAKNNILKITEDHLLFVERTGKATAIPAKEVKVGDTLYVRAGDKVEKDALLTISKVFEKGVYAPVTLSGTILVNDVHASCYFDVLSHEWSHRAMGVARAVHYVSPWILQWISGVGRKDGFPGWCRLAHKILTL